MERAEYPHELGEIFSALLQPKITEKREALGFLFDAVTAPAVLAKSESFGKLTQRDIENSFCLLRWDDYQFK